MKKLLTWLISRKRWLGLIACSLPFTTLAVWLLTFRTATLILFVVIWFIHIILGVGAGWAAVRLWYFRHHPLIKWIGVYITAFIVDVLSAIVLLFVAKGVILTWKFSSVLFISALISNLLRAPLIIYLIRGPSPLPIPDAKKSGEMEPQFWLNSFREIVKDEIRKALRTRSAAKASSRKRR
jgi:hypothetical protein